MRDLIDNKTMLDLNAQSVCRIAVLVTPDLKDNSLVTKGASTSIGWQVARENLDPGKLT